jgi:threonine/homoserine/homoserine lactone efflux protein
MDVILPVLAIVGVLFIGVVSPGPSFLFIAQRSLALSRTDGLCSSLGMGMGGLVFAGLALAGLHVLLTTFPAVYWGLKIVGGAYLLYLAYKIWKGARSTLSLAPDAPPRRPERLRSLGLGFLTQISNPKTAVVYATVFASLLPQQFDGRFVGALLPAVFVVETGWYSFVALVLSADGPRRVYARFKTGVDRTAAAALGAVGIKMAGEGVGDLAK